MKFKKTYAVFLGFFLLGVVTMLTGRMAIAYNPTPDAYWKFDETVAGSNAADSIGDNDGIPTDDPVPSTTVADIGYYNPRSASFDGSQYFTIDRPVQDSFSICAWIKTASVGGGSMHWESAPIMDSEYGGPAYDFGFGINNEGKLIFGNGGLIEESLVDDHVNGETEVNDEAWHNVCVTRNNDNGSVKLYVDGELDGSGTTGTGSLVANSNARIAAGYDGAAEYIGLIDNIRVYGAVLSENQVQTQIQGEDLNDDDIEDSEQPNVGGYLSSYTDKYVAIDVGEDCELTIDDMTSEGELEVQDPDFIYINALWEWEADCESETTTVKLYYYDVPVEKLVARKYSTITNKYFTLDNAVITEETINGHTVAVVTYEVTDNGDLDMNPDDGAIADPAGVGVLASSVGAPNTGYGYPSLPPIGDFFDQLMR